MIMRGQPSGLADSTARPGRPARVVAVIARLEGGAGLLAWRGIQQIDPQVCRPTIVTGSGDRLIKEAEAAGVEVIVEPALRATIAPRSDLQALRRLEVLLRRRGFDIAHTHGAIGGAIGRLAARRAGLPRIVHTYHGFPFHQFQSAPRRQAYIAIERRLGRFTDVALCVGAGVAAEAVRRELIAPERVRTIGVAVDGPERAAASTSARQPEARRRARLALGIAPEAIVVGAVGRLTYQKAPEDFLAALTELNRPDVTGVWIGGGEAAEQIARRARKMRAGQVMLAGDRADVLGLLPAYDVFVLPSRYEGLPTAVVEAMICGIPVVATAVNAVPDLVVPGETGLLVPPARPALLASAIRYLLDFPAAADQLAAAARDRIGDRYRASDLGEALLAAYFPAGAHAACPPASAHSPASGPRSRPS